MKKPIDITGKRFGMLTVLGYDHSFNHNTYWLCLCDCGNTKVVKRGSLIGGDIVSCGCYRNKLFMKNRQKSGHEDLSKFKFSMLTPICRDYEAERRYNYPKTMWKCQCDCGNVITVAAEKLKTGNIHLGWKGWCTKSIKILFQGVAAGVALILVLKLAIAFFSLINISVATFFNLFGVVFIVMIFSALLL